MAETHTNPIYLAAQSYGFRGWKVLPLAGPNDPGTSPGKRPLISAWHKMASSDEEVIAGWWEKWPDANVGVKFGPESNLVDLECDDEKQEAALAALFEGEFPETPTFESSRGKHRLFQWHQELPAADSKGIVYIGGVGFRTGGAAKGAQSVFPPSIHKTGKAYTWLIHPEEVEVAKIPDLVIAKIANHEGGLFGTERAGGKHPPEYWDKILSEGLDAGDRNQGAAELIGKQLSDLADPFNSGAISRLWSAISLWNTLNRPPLPANELHTTFQSILKRHREQSMTAGYREAFARYVDILPEPVVPTPTDAPQEPGKAPAPTAPRPQPQIWKIIQVDAKPVIWRLFSPLWSGFVELGSSALLSYKHIAEAVLEQKRFVLGPDFKMVWNGTKKEEGLCSKLVRIAEVVESEPEQHRDSVLAELALTIFDRCFNATEPHHLGEPTKLPDGTIWLQVRAMHSKMKDLMESVTSEETGNILRNAGAETKSVRFGGRSHTMKVLNHKNIENLKRLARCFSEDDE